MRRKRRYACRTLLLAVCLSVASLAAAPAGQARKRTVPFGFLGTNASMTFSGVPVAAREAQARLMARSGVETARVTFNWRVAQPYATVASVPRRLRGSFVTGPNGVPTFFEESDSIVRVAAQAGIRVEPTVIFSPRWASSAPRAHFYLSYMPRDPQTYAAYLRALIARYGPAGTFWSQNPTLPKVPIRDWEIWNEVTRIGDRENQPAQRYYPPVLRAAYRAVHGADRHARVVLAGIHNVSWVTLRKLYRAHIRRYFDVVALHPYTGTIPHLLEIVRLNRRVMRRYGDRRKPIYLTETTWTAAKGRIPRRNQFGPETSSRGQARLLSKSYIAFIRQRKKLRIKRLYWYQWASFYRGPSTFDFSGLVRQQGSRFVPQPALVAYARVARRYEGCRKSSDARRCHR